MRLPLLSELFSVVLNVKWLLFLKLWLGDGDKLATPGFDGEVEALAGFEVVKHFVLKLLPMQTTMTFELLLLLDWFDMVLSVLWIRENRAIID